MERGRKPVKRDPDIAQKVFAMRQYGLTIEQVSDLVSLSTNTLYKLYGGELENGVAAANLVVGKKLFERCQAGDVTALIFWAKTRMGWQEKQKVDVSNSDGSLAPRQAINIDFSQYSPEQLAELARAAFRGE